MTINTWLIRATTALTQANIGTARLDALVLLEDIMGKDKAWLLAHSENDLRTVQIKKLAEQLNKRAQHTPLAYIRGKSEFYGRDFVINHCVLEPRPESETMIDLLKQLKLSKSPTVADVGCGSGALGITAALEIPRATVDLFDIDPATLTIAKQNARRLQVNALCRQSDLLANSQSPYDVLLCNLPYVPDHYTINEAAAMEPHLAIFGGSDGLDVYRRLFEQLASLPWLPKYILCESMPTQQAELARMALDNGFHLDRTADFIQLFSQTARPRA